MPFNEGHAACSRWWGWLDIILRLYEYSTAQRLYYRRNFSLNMFKTDTPKERISDYGDMSTPTSGRKHSRFMGNPSERPPISQPDSAYASSESNQNNIVKVENDGSIPNTRREQNLALDKGTGEVFVSFCHIMHARITANNVSGRVSNMWT